MFRGSTLYFFKKTSVRHYKIGFNLKYDYDQMCNMYDDMGFVFRISTYAGFFFGTLTMIASFGKNTSEKLDTLEKIKPRNAQYFFETCVLFFATGTMSSLIHILRFRSIPFKSFIYIHFPCLFFLGSEFSIGILKFFVFYSEMLRDKYKKIDF